MKAAHWHVHRAEPGWTHDLRACAERIIERAADVPAGVSAAIALLEPIFERTRYPSARASEPIPAELIGEEDAQAAIRSAEEVIAWVRTLLPGPSR
ncbi:MAG: HEPN domain-containing protein [Chloroflexi bacterium]|nr:HEPN domain-containing protein [Chloroflexota bacterium]